MYFKTNTMKNIIAFAGSNSSQSINKKLVEFAGQSLKDIKIKVLDLNDFELPIYGSDLENEKGIPKTANDFFNHILESDGILLSLAEHNGNYSAVFKNLFDWMSRIDGKLWSNKPMFLMATSPGGRGGTSVLEVAKARFPYMGGNIVAEFSLPLFFDNFSDDKIVNDEFNSTFNIELQKFINAVLD